jgi:tripartite-type tricarboxylate transporter receptor subunit TctC
MLRMNAVVLALVVSGLASSQAQVLAQSQPSAWPSRPVTLVVPNPAGSATDLIARIVARDLTARLGQPIVIENRPGADGTIGVRQVVRSAPDGYTLSFGTPSAYAAAPYVYTNLSYDPVKDLAPVSMVGRTPYAFAVYPGLGVKNILEFVGYAKARPGKLNYSSIGEGSIAHLGMVVFADKMGLDLHHVPYKTTAQSIIDVATGIIHMQLASVPPIISLYESKKIQALGIAGKRRLPLMPDVPTMAEAGIPDYEQTFWLAMFAPAGTPAPIMTRLNREIGAGLLTDAVINAFIAQGVETEHSTPEALGEILVRDIEAYRQVASKAGIARH